MTLPRTTPTPAPGHDRPAPTPTPLQRPRVQPPLREALAGLDVRELEGQTVFDQLFGPEPAARR